MRRFYGYGHHAAKYWFIGQEEGGASSIGDLAARVAAWRTLGEHEVEDLQAFHQTLNFTRWFGRTPERQATWARLIQILLTAEGRPSTNADILRYQATRLGRADGESLLMEVMPLPAKNLATWYAAEIGLPELRSRGAYTASLRPHRIAHLKQRISDCQPHAVILYGDRRSWPERLGITFEPGASCDHARLGSSLLVAMSHPTAFGAKRTDFEAIGLTIVGLRR